MKISRTFARFAAVALLSIGTAVAPISPAQAVGWCAAMEPHRRKDGSYDLLADNGGKPYKKRAFSFMVSTHGKGIFPMTNTWSYYYPNQARGMHTPVLKGIKAFKLVAYWEGRSCTKWLRYGF